MVFSDRRQEEEDQWSALLQELRENLERSRRELSEITLMLEQSESEVKKLAQKNASATVQLQQIHSQFNTIPRADIKLGYDAAIETQQRLFLMRGQVDKLHSDARHLQHEIDVISNTLKILEGGSFRTQKIASQESIAETLEMLIQTQESERKRLSRQMHDGPAQALSNFILQTEIASRLFDLDQAKAKEELVALMATATSSFQKIRDFVFELRPMMLDDLGLTPTLKRYVEAIRDKSTVDIQLVITGTERRFETYLEVMIFRAIQELVSNALQHSQATTIIIRIDISDANVAVSVEDNGKGIDTEKIDENGGMGLKVIRDRIEMVGGYFDIDSSLEEGTRINFQVPAIKSAVIE
jgi:two-component system sensor histidine kinase DegS